MKELGQLEGIQGISDETSVKEEDVNIDQIQTSILIQDTPEAKVLWEEDFFKRDEKSASTPEVKLVSVICVNVTRDDIHRTRNIV